MLLEKKENNLLKREEAWVLVDHKGKPTPKRSEIIKELASELKSNEDLIIIDKIMTMPGKQASRVKVLVYSKAEDIPAWKAEKMKRRSLPPGKRKIEKAGKKAEEGAAPAEAKQQPEKKE